jgi:hypothetical protein
MSPLKGHEMDKLLTMSNAEITRLEVMQRLKDKRLIKKVNYKIQVSANQVDPHRPACLPAGQKMAEAMDQAVEGQHLLGWLDSFWKGIHIILTVGAQMGRIVELVIGILYKKTPTPSNQS